MKGLRFAAILAVVLACLIPALAMLYDSLRGPEGFTLAAYSGVLQEERQWTLFLRSTLVAAGATVMALVWGTAIGYAAWRLKGWKGATLEMLSYLPLLLPSLVVAMGWVHILGNAGIATAWVKSLFGLEKAPINLFTPTGASFVLSLCYFPCVSILAAQGFRSVDPSAIRAAQLTSGTWSRVWTIWRPLLSPYLATGAMLTFLLAFADFGVPSALMVNVYPIEVFTQFSAYFDVKRAIASCAPPVALVAVLFVALQLMVRRNPYENTGARSRPFDGPVSKWGVGVALAAILLSLVLPMIFLVATAKGAYSEALRIAGDQVMNSLAVATIGGAMLLGAGLLFAGAYRGLGSRLRVVSEAVVLLPLLVPGTAVGLGILYFITANTWPFSAMYPGTAIVAYAGAARFITFPALILAAGLVAIRRSVLQAASLHAGPGRVATAIIAPLLWPALAAAGTIGFLFCLGELSASVLVNPPGTMTLPVRLASLLHFGKDSIVASLCVMLTGVIGCVLFLGILMAGGPIRLRLQHAHRN